MSEDFDAGIRDKAATLAQDCREDPKLRARAEADPRAVLSEYGIELPLGRDVRIAENTAETFHMVLPPDPNSALADAQIEAVAGGSSTAQRTDGSFKSASTILSCFACAS